MKTAVVILNWNTVGYLRSFVPGILNSLGPDDRLIVADSGSTDGSLEMLQKEFPEVGRLPLGANFGFAGGYDKALEGLDAEYYLLLNSDIEVSSDWLAPLEEWMDSHPECAVCGPKLHALDPDGDGWKKTDRFEYAGAAGGRIDRFGYPFCRGRVLSKVEMDEGQYDLPARVAWVTGAALMVRSSVWKELGGLDAEFFAHMEEIDFCWRVALAGYQCWVVPQSVVYHIGGGTLPKESPLKLKLNFRNSLWMLRKNLPATIGGFRASLRIAFRRVLDLGSALVYLVSGKKEFARAIIEAHREADARKIVRSLAAAGRPEVLSGKMILLNYLRRR